MEQNASPKRSRPVPRVQKPLEERFLAVNPLSRWADHPILLAVSGGADSVALLRLFLHFRERFGLRIFAAHANHQLRGEDSDGDETFVQELCRQLEVPCAVRRLEIARTSNGLENDARNARYAFLRETAESLGCRYIMLAHHRDDQAETILHRILRGTGIAGLAGMSRLRPLDGAVSLIRPMLTFSKKEILDYLDSFSQPWRTDASNFSTDLTRNRIRQELLPQLRENFNPQLEAALLRLGEAAAEMQKMTDSLTQRLAELCVSAADGEIRIVPRKSLLSDTFPDGIPEFLWTELLRHIWRKNGFPEREMGRSEWLLLSQMLLHPNVSGIPQAHVFPGNIRAERTFSFLCLTPFSPARTT